MFRRFKRLCFSAPLLFSFLAATNIAHGDDARWKPLRTGAGGWMTGMHIHPSGTPVFARSDVGSAYRWDEKTRSWANVVTASSMPSQDVHWSRHSGVLSIVSAPSDASVAYLAYQDGLYRSRDGGDHWTRTSFPKMAMKPNDDSSKLSGERLSVDPRNPDVVFFGSINDGLWRTRDGGTSWSRTDGVPYGSPERGVRQVLFDVNSTGRDKTNRVFAVVDGEGVFESVDAGDSWNNVGPDVAKPHFYDAEISSRGVLFVCGVAADGRTIHVRSYDGEAWRQVFSATGHSIGEIALDPFDHDRVLLMTQGFSQIFLTREMSSSTPTWKKLTYDRTAKNIPWLAWTEGGWFSLGEVVFDPSTKDRLWIAEGTGVWRTSDLNDENVTWSEISLGQEHLVSNDIVSMPDGASITAHWDRPIFLHTDADEFPAKHQPSERFNSAWSLDRHPDDPGFVVAIIEDHRFCCYDDGQHRNSGYSEDGGKTWKRFKSQPTFRGKESIHGQIAVSAGGRDNIVWLPVWNSMPYYTTDRGVTWKRSQLPGNSGNCCIAAPWFQRECLVADRVQPLTFYLYDWAEGHLFRTSDGGKDWLRFENVLPKWCYHGKLCGVYGHAGHLWFAPGRQESAAAIGGLSRSVDGGETWKTLADATEVLNVAIGKAATDASYPTVFIQGRVDGHFGYFQSDDEGKTWSKIGSYPLGVYDAAKVMQADPWKHGRLYLGFGGNGFMYYDAESE
ncbi:MAG: hypothetical protein AAFU85_10450 [Planctomycetota bacterium]